MQLQWTSLDAARPAVRWGERSGQLKWHVRAESLKYTRDDMCGAPATTVRGNPAA